MTTKIEVLDALPQVKIKEKRTHWLPFEVYFAKDKDGNILYIGSGKLNRHKHCTSGISTVYGLNKMHFNGDIINVEVVMHCSTKEDSLRAEQEFIESNKPLFNKSRVTSTERFSALYRLRIRLFSVIKTYRKENKTKRAVCDTVREKLTEFLNIYRLNTLVDGTTIPIGSYDKLLTSARSKSPRKEILDLIFEINDKTRFIKIRKELLEDTNST